MKIRKGLMILVGLLLVVFVFAPNFTSHFRSSPDPSPHECPRGAPNDPDQKKYPSATPITKIIKLTDSGEVVDRCAWTFALKEIRHSPDTPKLVVLYVHGWKHNADEHDSDRQNFNQLIDDLTEREEKDATGRLVIGVYVGWDAATPVGVLENLTFWTRKRVADRISQSAILAKLIGSINNIIETNINVSKRKDRKYLDRDQVIIIGHSFGARIVFSAISQLLIYQVQDAYPSSPRTAFDRATNQEVVEYDIVKGPADAIVMLNPALEASAYTAVESIRRYKERFSPMQQPLLISISTDNDSATACLFPIGQWIVFNREPRQMTTLGNYKDYFTHELSVATHDDTFAGARENEPWFDKFCTDKLCLKRTGKQQIRNPFLIVTTNSQVLDGHNGIWKPKFVEWLKDFLSEIDRRHRG